MRLPFRNDSPAPDGAKSRLALPYRMGKPSLQTERRCKETNAMVKDPVCGKMIDPTQAAAQSDYDGQTYYFCCTACKERFDRNPQQYAGPQAALR
jgi:YHS domain-containing protein